MSVTVLKGFLSVSNMKIIYNFTLICTLFIIQFLDSQRTSKSFRSAKVLAVSLHLLSRLTRSAVVILWDNIGEALNLSQEVVHGSLSQESDLEELWYPGLHKLWYPGIRDMSTWSKFGAHGEHGDVFLFSNLGAL